MRKAMLGIVLGVVAIILMQGGLMFMNELGGISWPVRPMTKDIRDMPKKMGNWFTTEAGELDSRIFAKLDATAAEQRTYEDDRGNKVHYHGSVFEHFAPCLPHTPTVCYPANGWELLDQTSVEISLPDGTTFKPILATFEKDVEKVFVLFWFQFGEITLADGGQLQKALEHYRPEKQWPSMVKVLLQMPYVPNFQNAEPLQNLAAHIYEYTRTLQDGKAPAPVAKQESAKSDS